MSASTADIVNNYCNVDQMSDPMTDEATAAVISIKDDVGGTPKRKRKREKRPPDPSDPAVIAAAAAIQTAKIEAEQALLAAQEEAAIPTPMENCKYYTSLGLGTVCIVSAFAFLFLVPFVLDPAISTLLHHFVDQPVTCKVTSIAVKSGKSKCQWSSCREGCTVDMFKCWQVRVIYAPDVPFGHSNDTSVSEISDGSWVDLTRYDTLENQTMIDTPLLVNIKGCGYPPEVACARFASDYEQVLNESRTFPCYYSQINPWIVIEVYNYDLMLGSVIASIVVPNALFVISLSILLYWYCPFCQARCQKYEEQIDQDYEDEEPRLEVDELET